MPARLPALLALCILGASSAAAAEPVRIVASFSILADMVREVGREHVEVRSLVGPNGDAHVYEPTPADARDTAAADLIVVNGFGFEGWLDRLVQSSGYSGPIAIATNGVTPLRFGEAAGHEEHPGEGHDHSAENIDPHAWQSIANAQIYVKNIATALCEVDPEDCVEYERNAAAYSGELAGVDASIKSGFAAVPAERRKVITTHDSFGYFAHAYGLTFLAPQGVSTDAEASAADVARLIDQIRGEGVSAIFFENVSDPRLIEQIARETGARPGGELYSDALSEPDGPAGSYVAMMRHNANLLQSAMLGS